MDQAMGPWIITRFINSEGHPDDWSDQANLVCIILANDDGEIMTMTSEYDTYPTFPGGEPELQDDYYEFIHETIERTTGCKVQITGGEPMASTKMWWDELCQLTWCYRGRVVGTGHPTMKQEDTEALDGLRANFMSVEDTMAMLEGSEPETEFAQCSKERDLYFLRMYVEAVAAEKSTGS
ncbi:hypothetical protein MMC13_000475 [Lambiella insularis]|nr:hypothetical protein [Lambiella insularis]